MRTQREVTLAKKWKVGVARDNMEYAMLLRMGEFMRYTCLWKEKVVLVLDVGNKKWVKVDSKTLEQVKANSNNVIGLAMFVNGMTVWGMVELMKQEEIQS